MRHQSIQKVKVRKPRQNSKLPEDIKETHARPCPSIPPPMQMVRKERVWRRFNMIGAVTNQAFTLANGHDQFLVVTNVTGASVSFIDAWRIRRIRVWVTSEVNGGTYSTRCTLTPVGSDASNMNNDPEQVYTCESSSTARPGCMEIVTCKNRPLGGWHFTSALGSGSGLFQCSILTGGGSTNRNSQMDIEFETCMNLAGTPLGYTVVTGTTTVGTLGARGILSGFQPGGINNLG